MNFRGRPLALPHLEANLTDRSAPCPLGRERYVGVGTVSDVRALRWQKVLAQASSPARRAAIVLMICNYAQAGIGFALQLWLANRLGADGYGSVSYGLLVGAICSTLVTFGSDRTLVRDLVQNSDRQALLTASMLQRSAIAFLVLGGCWLYGGSRDGPEATKAWTVLAGGVWGATMGLMPTAWLDSRYEMGISAGLALLERILFGVLAACLLAGVSDASPAILVLGGLVAARLAGGAAQWIYASRSFRPVWRGCLERAWQLTCGNSLVFGGALASLLLTHWNQIVLESRAGPTRLAHYAVAFQLVSLVTIAQSQLVRLLTPQISILTREGNGYEERRRGLLRHCGYAAFVTLVLALPLLLLAPWVLAIGYRPEYQSAVLPLRILCLWVICYGPALIINQYLLCLRLNRAYLVLTVLSGGLGLLLGQVLVPRWGASGVALSLLCSHVPNMAVQGLLVMRRVRSLRDSSPAKTAAPAALMTSPVLPAAAAGQTELLTPAALERNDFPRL